MKETGQSSFVHQRVLEGHSSRDLTGHLLVRALLLVLPLLVPVFQTLWQSCVLVHAPRSLHKLLICRLLCKRTFAQQLHHVALIQNLLLQQSQRHLQEGTGSELCSKLVCVVNDQERQGSTNQSRAFWTGASLEHFSNFHLRNVPEIEETQCSPTRTFQYFDNEPLCQLCSLKRPDRFLLRETIKSHLNQHCDLWRSHHRIVLELNVRVLCVWAGSS